MTISEKQLSAYSFQAFSKDFEGIRPLNVQMSLKNGNYVEVSTGRLSKLFAKCKCPFV